MLDNVLRIGRGEPTAENTELVNVLTDWGVTANKDLVLDLSGIGNMFGAGPEIPIILQYEPHAHHAAARPRAHRLPRAALARRQVRRQEHGREALRHHRGQHRRHRGCRQRRHRPQEGQEGSVHPRRRRHLQGTPSGRFVVVGTSQWAENRAMGSRTLGNRDLFMNMINWLTADEDLISIRPKATEDRPLTMTAQKLNLVFWLSVVIFPLAVVGFGLATWWKRR